MAASETIDILFCANPGYYQHVAVAAVSLSDSNPGNRFNLHFITCDSDPEAERKLRKTIASRSNLDLFIYYSDHSYLGEFFIDGFISKECYLRLIAPEILPGGLGKVLYLDSDMVVVDDVRPLWDTDLAGHLVAAAPDYPRLEKFMSPEYRDALGIPMQATYVNSGMLLMDLDTWRKDGMTAQFVSFVQAKGSKLAFYDQDAINAVLAGRILIVDPRWNLQARMYYTGQRHRPFEFAETVSARATPAIIHYTGSEKPWLFRSRVPKKGVYMRALRKTAWSGATPGLTSPLHRLEFAADDMMSRLFNLDYLQLLYKMRRSVSLIGEKVLKNPGMSKSREQG
jgi:lipopolysaccharide biosynthesis glycosyltransferase